MNERRGLSFWWATFFGSGLAPAAPGTFGTIASFVIWAPVVMMDLPVWGRLLAVILIFGTGIVAAQRTADLLGDDDPKSVVIDEVAGQGVALLFLPSSGAAWMLLSFALFRFFDILKPFPVSWADKKLHGGLGIMLDDIIAGLYALFILTFLLYWLHANDIVVGGHPSWLNTVVS